MLLRKNQKEEPEIILDCSKLSEQTDRLWETLRTRIVSQDKAIAELVDAMATFESGLSDPTKPISCLLFCGPTGVGKTEVCRALAEGLFDNPDAFTKIACGEVTEVQRHYISRLTGSPPGYVSANVKPALGQEALNAWRKLPHGDRGKVYPAIICFDEFEKACEELSQLILNLLDTGKITMGDNSVTDCTQCIIILTSNMGSREAARLAEHGSFGFAGRKETDTEKIILDAGRKHMSPEFRNRLTKIIIFEPLSKDDCFEILDIQLRKLQTRIRKSTKPFLVSVTKSAKQRLIDIGYSESMGAREIQRTINEYVQRPLAKASASGQIVTGDVCKVDFKNDTFTYINCGSSLPFIAALRADPQTAPVANFLLSAAPASIEFPSFGTP